MLQLQNGAWIKSYLKRTLNGRPTEWYHDTPINSGDSPCEFDWIMALSRDVVTSKIEHMAIYHFETVNS